MKNSNLILFALAALIIYMLFFNKNGSSFGAVVTKTIIIPTPKSPVTLDIPVKDINGSPLTTLSLSIPAGSTSVPVNITSYSEGKLIYSVNNVSLTKNIYSSSKGATDFIANGFYTNGDNKTKCIKSSDIAQRGFQNSSDLADTACEAAGFPNGADPATANTAACTASGGGTQYTCRPNVFSVIVSVPNFVQGTTVSYTLQNSSGATVGSSTSLPLNKDTTITTFNSGGYIIITINVPGQTPTSSTTLLYGNNYLGTGVSIPSDNNKISSTNNKITLPSTTINVTNNASSQITV